MDYFSQSEVPSLCLRDVKRTIAFRDAIRRTVRAGDVVLDAGAGSGILAFFAAQAGAKKVYAVEVDEAMTMRLRENAARNGFGAVIEVICTDIRSLTLPERVDVMLAEMIETWLLDELQVPALNTLRAKGIVDANTRMIPHRYEAFATFGSLDFELYGFDVPFPVHDWPDLNEENGWHPLPFHPHTMPTKVFDADFRQALDPSFDVHLRVNPTYSGTVNAIRLTGTVHLDDGHTLGETVVFNGKKVLPIEPVRVTAGVPASFRIQGIRGGRGGLESVRVSA